MTHRREKLRLGKIGRFGLLPRVNQFGFGAPAFGDLGTQSGGEFRLPPGNGTGERDRRDEQ